MCCASASGRGRTRVSAPRCSSGRRCPRGTRRTLGSRPGGWSLGLRPGVLGRLGRREPPVRAGADHVYPLGVDADVVGERPACGGRDRQQRVRGAQHLEPTRIPCALADVTRGRAGVLQRDQVVDRGAKPEPRFVGPSWPDAVDRHLQLERRQTRAAGGRRSTSRAIRRSRSCQTRAVARDRRRRQVGVQQVPADQLGWSRSSATASS